MKEKKKLVTWKHTKSRPTMNLSASDAWMFRRIRSYSVNPMNSIQPKM
jgi:hypothetical protein